MTLNGAPIDPAMTYTVAANSFLANGGDNFFTFAEGTNRVDTGQADLGITVAYFAAHPVVSPAPLGRAVLAEEPGQADADADSSGSGGEADADAHADADGSAADGSAGSASSGSGTSSGAGGSLANTGSDAPYGLALGASVLVASGLLIVALRRRRVHS